MNKNENTITVHALLYPISVMAVTIFLLFAFQMSQILRDHDTLVVARAQQEKGVEDSQRIQAQLVALIVGSQKLAADGNENALKIVERLKTMGVIPQPAPQAAPAAMGGAMTEPVSPAPVPALQNNAPTGPVKP